VAQLGEHGGDLGVYSPAAVEAKKITADNLTLRTDNDATDSAAKQQRQADGR
jgi:hypothetical protein